METIERNGHTFKVCIVDDDISDAPWEREDGHGPVSEWTRRAKAPWERVLCSDQRMHRYYDYAAAVGMARAESWDAAPLGEGTPGQRAARAADADYERLRRFCAGDWRYVGVVVRLVCPECGQTRADDYAHAIWGIESDSPDYLMQLASELVDETLRDMEESAVDCHAV
jgi:hypothetical protein